MIDKKISPESISIQELNLAVPDSSDFYRGKVRDVYRRGDKIIIIASDRISAFDHVLPRPIPFKGAVLNSIAAHSLYSVKDIVPQWLEETPDPNVSIGKYCQPIKVEMVIRGYLAGHAWRKYRKGEREICGAEMPESLKESDRFPVPIITPTTKAEEGHDEDISPAELIDKGIVSENVYKKLEQYTYSLFRRGSRLAAGQGLILVDTKYEFGFHKGEVMLMDEIHTPDSSRYYIADGYEERQANGEAQIQLSKEFVREWLMENDFQGREGEMIPDMSDEFVYSVSEKYLSLHEKITGHPLNVKDLRINPQERIRKNIHKWIENNPL